MYTSASLYKVTVVWVVIIFLAFVKSVISIIAESEKNPKGISAIKVT